MERKYSSTTKKIGGNIRRYRDLKGLSQDSLARKAKITYTSLTKIETGAIHNPGIDSVIKIAHALDITIDELLKDTGRTIND